MVSKHPELWGWEGLHTARQACMVSKLPGLWRWEGIHIARHACMVSKQPELWGGREACMVSKQPERWGGREACIVSKQPGLWGGRDYTSTGRPAWSVSTLGCEVGGITHREGGLHGQPRTVGWEEGLHGQ